MSKLLSPYHLNSCTLLHQVYTIVAEKPRFAEKHHAGSVGVFNMNYHELPMNGTWIFFSIQIKIYNISGYSWVIYGHSCLKYLPFTIIYAG